MQKYFILKQVIKRLLYVSAPAEFVRTLKGKELLFLNGNTYSKGGNVRDGGARYSCSKRRTHGCHAHVHVSKEGKMVKVYARHNHEPPKYKFTRDGCYIPHRLPPSFYKNQNQ